MQGLVPPSALVIARKAGPHARCCGRTVLAPGHVDTGLVMSTPGSGPQRRARQFDVRLATSSTRALPPRRRARHFDEGLATSPPRHAYPHIHTDLAHVLAPRWGSSRRLAPPQVGLRLATSTRGSTRRGARDLNAGLTISTPFRRGPRVLDLRRATSKPRRHRTRDLDPHLVTSTRGSPR
ncbi:hypothetical protein K438DRAFT_1768490 [Mycena galopus ATCC 62051]|nr:hypothetical protein K438DRAFT_1768490 [Mycena galopus ATCC 62051]